MTYGNNHSAAPIGFESDLWRAADALRSNMDAAEYKHVILSLIFLKYISDAFRVGALLKIFTISFNNLLAY